jgi:H+/Cl- antiporter ClcA
MILDIFALIVIALLVGVAIWLVVLLGSLPGNIARSRNHPQAEAITALSWVGLITIGLSWFVAMVWAYYKPDATNNEIQQQVDELRQQVNRLQEEEEKS